jgi:hypothetical protein
MLKKDPKEEELPWDKKKIIIGFLFFLVVLFATLYFKTVLFPPTKTQVEGAYTQIDSPKDQEISNVSQNFQKNLDQIQNNVNNLNVKDVATSSPQVQKVLNDIKSLQNLPRDQAREACNKICSGL